MNKNNKRGNIVTYFTNFSISLLSSGIVKAELPSFALRSADGILLRCPALLETFTTLALLRNSGNKASHTLNVPK